MQTVAEPTQDVDVDLEIILSWEAEHCQSAHSDPGNEVCTHQVSGSISGCKPGVVQACEGHLAHKSRVMDGGYACRECRKLARDCWRIEYL